MPAPAAAPVSRRSLRRLELALAASGAMLLLALLLPLRPGPGGSLFAWHLLDLGSGLRAVGFQAALGLALLLLGALRLSPLVKGGAGLAGIVLLALLTAADEDLRVSVLPLLPLPLQLALPFLLAAVILASAAVALRTVAEDSLAHRRASSLLALLALPAVAGFYLWPLEPGSVLDACLSSGRLALLEDLPPGLVLRLAGATALPLLPLLWMLTALGAALLPRRPPGEALPSFLGPLALLLLALGIRSAMQSGVDAFAALGLRSALLVSAALLVGAEGLAAMLGQLLDQELPDTLAAGLLLRDALLFDALAPQGDGDRAPRRALQELSRRRFLKLWGEWHRGDRRETLLRLRLVLSGVPEDLVSAARGAALVAAVGRARRPTPNLLLRFLCQGRRVELASSLLLVGTLGALTLLGADQEPSPPIQTGAAPEWAERFYSHELPALSTASPQESAQAVKRAALACQLPELSAAVRAFEPLLASPARNRRALLRLGDRLNSIAARSRLPFFVDLGVERRRSFLGNVHWDLELRSYRVVKVASQGAPLATTLWLSRVDDTPAQEQRLGWKRRGKGYAVVSLDAVKSLFWDGLAPALAGNPDGPYAAAAGALKRDLEEELSREPGAQALFNETLDCFAKPYFESTEEQTRCNEAMGELEPSVVPILARMVEAHELTHLSDGERLAPPAPLLRLLDGYAEPFLGVATAELSAYLNEVAQSSQPRLALTHFMAIASRHRTAEYFAGRVALDHLKEGNDQVELLSLPPEEIRARAARAWASLFAGRR